MLNKAEVIHMDDIFKKRLYKMLMAGTISEQAMDYMSRSSDPELEDVYEILSESDFCRGDERTPI